MRLLRIITLISFSYISSVYAENENTITSSPIDTNIPADELTRLSNCEREVQNLTGRVEVLEHAIKQLQSQTPSAVAPVTKAPSMSSSVTTETINVDSSAAQSLAGDESEKRDYDSALAALKESRFENAEALFLQFMEKYPNSKRISNSYFWYAESFYRRGEFEKAGMYYLKGYKQFPKSEKASDFLLKLASSLGEMKKTKDACIILNKLEVEYKQRPASSVKRGYDMRKKYGCDSSSSSSGLTRGSKTAQ